MRAGPQLLKKNENFELVPNGGGEIPVLGTCELMLESEKRYDLVTFYVKGANALLRYPTANCLEIIKVVNSIDEGGKRLSAFVSRNR